MGEPGGGHTPPPRAEHIGAPEATRGTETSKYPEEEKSNEIPLVAASERGAGQTGGAKAPPGSWGRPTRQSESGAEAERPGRAGGTGLQPRTRIRAACRAGTRVPPDT